MKNPQPIKQALDHAQVPSVSPLLNIALLNDIPILQQLKWEEALLRADDQNWCLLNQGSPPAIVMGISGKIESQICTKRLQENPIPVIRRFSGGGTVVVDEQTLFVTFICRSDALPILPFPKPVMKWTAEIYRPLFPAETFNLIAQDYVLKKKKWGGNAQAIIKNRWLHHSSILWDFHLPMMDYLLIPPKMPDYRSGRSHADFLCSLKPYWPCSKMLQTAILKELENHFTLVERKAKDLIQIESRPHRKATEIIQ
jgi:lipoate-protein ligase A